MRRAAALGLRVAVGVAVAGAGSARAEVDWSVDMALPDRDFAFGLTGGVVFDEDRRDAATSGMLGLDASYLDGLFGAHLGVRAHREGFDWRVAGLAEVTWWYLLLLGTGVQVGQMLGDGGPGVPDTAVALTLLVGAPFPIATLDEGRGGSLVLMPYGRPGLRFRGERPGLDRDDRVRGYHEIGVSLRWTSFGW